MNKHRGDISFPTSAANAKRWLARVLIAGPRKGHLPIQPENAIRLVYDLQLLLPYVILLISGKLVVNEFESLEAMIDASGQSGLNSPRADSYTDARVSVFLEKFWISTISNTISSVQSRI